MLPDASKSQRGLDWHALLVGGHSAAGKTSAAERIGLSLGVPWMMVDDVRLAFQRAKVTLPRGTESLYSDKRPDFRNRTPEEQCAALIDVGHVMSAALEAIVENHVDQQVPIVIEGDGIVPSLLARPAVFERTAWIRASFIVEPDESAVRAALVARGGSWVAGRTEAEL